MPKPSKPQPSAAVPNNNTVKLSLALKRRISRAMMKTGFTVWSEFCRVGKAPSLTG